MERLNIERDVRHPHRALTPEEVAASLKSAETSGKFFQRQSPETRVQIYTCSYLTELRNQELASLTPSSFKLDDVPPTLTIEAARSKHRKKYVLPIHPDLFAKLREWTKGLRPTQPLFLGLGKKKLSAMIRLDLKLAEIQYQTADGIADFHAAGRHSYITQLIRSGASLPEAMELA